MKTYDKNLNRAVFDVQMQLFARMDLTWISMHKERVRAAFDDMCLADETFADSLNRATADRSRMSNRLRAWASRLEQLGAQIAEPRIIPPAEAANEG